MKIFNPYKIYVSRQTYASMFDALMDIFIEIIKEYGVEVKDKRKADFILNNSDNNYIIDQMVKPLPIKWFEFYTYYIPKKEFDQSIFDSAYKMLMSNDLDSMKLGADLLFWMERPPNGNELSNEIRKRFQSDTLSDIEYYLKTIMIAHNYED